MNKKTIRFVIPLANVDDPVVGIELEPDFVIEKWPIDKLVQLIVEHFSESNDVQIRIDIECSCCLNSYAKNVYLVSGKANYNKYWQKAPESASFREKYFDHGGYIAKVEEKIKLMRLFKEGQMETKGVYVYEQTPKEYEPIVNTDLGKPSHVTIPYSLTKSEKKELIQFLKTYNTPLKPPYLQLAFENFNQSYSVEYFELAFLTLMIGVEAIFNDGNQELKYRITRGMAVLLGSTYGSHEIYDSIRTLYDKRSQLVHTGRCKDLTFDDVGRLRFLLRASILKLLDLRITKDNLSRLLTISGFGDSIA